VDHEKLEIIKKDILTAPIGLKRSSSDICGLYVDGTGKLTFDIADAPFHAFKAYSQYDYTVYLFIAGNNNKEEIKKIFDKYPNTRVYNIPPLTNALYYNEWMYNYPWFVIDPKHMGVLTFQEDGMLIKPGWEEYVIKGDYDYIGAPWKSEIQALAVEYLKPTWVGNGGLSYRKIDSLKKCLEYVNNRGGQHKFFKGIKINGVTQHNSSWLAEDILFASVGFTYNFFKDVNIEEAARFSLEPIEFSLYMDKDNPLRPLGFHKCDF